MKPSTKKPEANRPPRTPAQTGNPPDTFTQLDPPLEREEPLSEEQELLDATEGLDLDVQQKALTYLAQKNIDVSVISVNLYKEKTEGGVKLCGKWKNQIPDSHNVGVIHGSGRYVLIITWPPRGIKKIEFELDKIYDQYKQEAAISGATPQMMKPPGEIAPAAPQFPSTQNNGHSDTVALLQVLVPLLRPPQDNMQHMNMMKMMMETFAMASVALKKSLLDQADFMEAIQERMLELGERQETTDEIPPLTDGTQTMPPVQTTQPKSLFELALPYIGPILAKLAGATSQEIQQTAGMVQAIPAVKEVLTDPKHKADCKKLIEYLDKKLGEKSPGKVDEILKALNVDRAMYQ